jgi:hypothetical protein
MPKKSITAQALLARMRAKPHRPRPFSIIKHQQLPAARNYAEIGLHLAVLIAGLKEKGYATVPDSYFARGR